MTAMEADLRKKKQVSREGKPLLINDTDPHVPQKGKLCLPAANSSVMVNLAPKVFQNTVQ